MSEKERERDIHPPRIRLIHFSSSSISSFSTVVEEIDVFEKRAFILEGDGIPHTRYVAGGALPYVIIVISRHLY